MNLKNLHDREGFYGDEFLEDYHVCHYCEARIDEAQEGAFSCRFSDDDVWWWCALTCLIDWWDLERRTNHVINYADVIFLAAAYWLEDAYRGARQWQDVMRIAQIVEESAGALKRKAMRDGAEGA